MTINVKVIYQSGKTQHYIVDDKTPVVEFAKLIANPDDHVKKLEFGNGHGQSCN